MAGTGFEPVGFLGNRQFTGAMSKYWIATGATNKICYGQPVAIATTGTITGLTVTPVIASKCVGIFLGCQYLNSDGNPTFSLKWPAAQASLGAYAYVADDPFTVFRAKILTTSGADATSTIANIGSNALMEVTFPEVGSSGRCGFGVSVATTPDATADRALRIVGLTNDNVSVLSTEPNPMFINTGSTTFTHALVTINFGVHVYTQGTSVA